MQPVSTPARIQPDIRLASHQLASQQHADYQALSRPANFQSNCLQHSILLLAPSPASQTGIMSLPFRAPGWPTRHPRQRKPGAQQDTYSGTSNSLDSFSVLKSIGCCLQPSPLSFLTTAQICIVIAAQHFILIIIANPLVFIAVDGAAQLSRDFIAHFLRG